MATATGTDLKVEALIAVAAAVRAAGIDSVKLTGGDPALYGPLEEAVVGLRREVGFHAVEVISRHPSIGGRAALLELSGVTQFNMSIDTLDPLLHREICGVDDLPVADRLMYIVFPGCLVRLGRGDEEGERRAQAIGRIFEIPVAQMRFLEMFDTDHPDAPAQAGR